MHLLTWMFFRVVFTCFKDFSHGHYWRLKKSVKCERYLQPGTTWRNSNQLPLDLWEFTSLTWFFLERNNRNHLPQNAFDGRKLWGHSWVTLWGDIGEENNGRVTLGSAPAGGQFHTGQHRNCSYQNCGSSCNWAISWANQVSSKRSGSKQSDWDNSS